MGNIEIGIDIVAKIYLHVTGNDLPTPFIVKNIVDVKDGELGTTISYNELVNPFSSELSTIDYVVDESVDDIKDAIKDVKEYRDVALKAINNVLDK